VQKHSNWFIELRESFFQAMEEWLGNTVGWSLPLIIVVSSLILGWITEYLIKRRLIRMSQALGLSSFTVIAKGFKGLLWIIILLEGVYAAISMLNLPAPQLILLRKVSISAVLLVVTHAMMRISTGFVEIYAQRNQHMSPIFSSSLLRNITRGTVYTIGILITLETIGISVTPILTALGVGGLAVALALKDTLSNMFAGIQLMATRQITIGDYIMLESGQEGAVTDIHWRFTVLKALKGNSIVIPNAKLASAIVANYSIRDKQLRAYIHLTIGHANDLQLVEQVILQVVQQTLGVVNLANQDSIRVRFQTVTEFGINILIIIPISEYLDQFATSHEVVRELHSAFRQQGITFSQAAVEHKRHISPPGHPLTPSPKQESNLAPKQEPTEEDTLLEE
jgi:small-conductance mechanosensitive channel